MPSMQDVIADHIGRALAFELTSQWIKASDAWLDAFVVTVKHGSPAEARQYLDHSRACDKQAASEQEAADARAAP